jgi:hypothetical protein
MRVETGDRIPHEIFYIYPDVVRSVSIIILRKYRAKGNAFLPSDFYKDLVSECYVYYLEAKYIYKDILAQYPPERQFGYLRKAVLNMWRNNIAKRIRSERGEDDLFQILDGTEYEALEERLEFSRQKKKVWELSRILIGEEVDESNVIDFIQRLKEKDTDNTSLSQSLKQSLIREMELVEQRLSESVMNYAINERGEIEAKRNRGVYDGKSWSPKKNTESVLGHIRQAITEQGLYDIKDIRLYLNNKGVIFTDTGGVLDNKIRKAFKSLGMERPKSKRLQKNAHLNSHIRTCMLQGMTKEEIVASIKKNREAFQIDESFNLKQHVKNTYFHQKYRQEEKEKKALMRSRTVWKARESVKKTMVSICISEGEFLSIRSKVNRTDVPFKTVVKREISKVNGHIGLPKETINAIDNSFPQYTRLLEAIPEEANMDTSLIAYACDHFETIASRFYGRRKVAS